MADGSAKFLLELDGLAVRAGGRLLAERVSLRIGPGEAVALTGPSGCGKSSLLRVVAGLDNPAAGEVRLEGRSPEAWGWPAFRRRVVRIEQTPVLRDESVDAALRRPFTYRENPGPYPEARARDLRERLDLGDIDPGLPARRLSVGQRQRVCLIRALLLEPKALLLDEPTSALDAETANLVETLLRATAEEQGTALLLVTHDDTQADRLAHRRAEVTWCLRGECECEDTADTPKGKATLARGDAS